MIKKESRRKWIHLLVLTAALLAVNVIAHYQHGFIDLTEDKRFTLSEPTKQMLVELNEPIRVQILLEGNFPAEFRRLQSSTEDMLRRFRSYNNQIDFEFINPNEGDTQEKNKRRQELTERGIHPINMRVQEAGERVERLIYPYAIVNTSDRALSVNLLEDEVPGVDPQITLNNSIGLLEYKLANAIHKVQSPDKPTVAFTTGQGEVKSEFLIDLNRSLREYYQVGRIHLDSVDFIDPQKAPLLIVPGPTEPFSEKKKFALDQYIMNGGKVIWLISKLAANLDSVRKHQNYVPREYTLDLDDLFFRYGFRLNPDLVQDLQCSSIPMVIGRVGSQSQMELFPWYYHPTAAPFTDHPIVSAIDRVNLFFPNSIDTIRTKGQVDKTILLASSEFSRFQMIPAQINFDILRYEPDPDRFNRPHLPLAVLFEGEFYSAFEKRLSLEMEGWLSAEGLEFQNKVRDNAMMVVSDIDFALNSFHPNTGEMRPAGFNPYENRLYSNKDFLLNAVEYMLDDSGIIQARNREVQLRLINEVKARTEMTQWQLLNIAAPIGFVFFFGLFYNFVRRRRYARKAQ